MLTFEECQKRKAEYLKALTEFEQMIDYRKTFLKNASGKDDVVNLSEWGWWNENERIRANNHLYDKDLVIRSLNFLIEFNHIQFKYLDDTLEDPGAASDIVDHWLDSVNNKYEFKHDEED